MDELMISGRRHAASIRVAKQYGYHSDYIGQLIRGNKVKGQKVGRSWYVDIESLAEYLGKEVPPAPKNITEPVGVPAPREEKKEAAPVAPQVEAVVEERELGPAVEPKPEPAPVVVEEKIESTPAPVAEEVTHHVPVTVRAAELEEKIAPQKNVGLTYVSEEEALLPPLRKNIAPRKLDIEVEAIVTAEVSPKQKIETEETPLRAGYAGQILALAGIALAVLSLVTASGSLLVYSMSAGPAQTASIHFSMPE